jgi:hypothetical protein
MPRPTYSPCTLAIQPRPDPLLLFIQQALLTLVYSDRSPASRSERRNDVNVAT